MKEKTPKKSTKGRKTMAPGAGKIVIRASVPALQAQAAKEAASALNMEFNEFVESALKEAIYQAALSKNTRIDPSNFVSGDPAETHPPLHGLPSHEKHAKKQA